MRILALIDFAAAVQGFLLGYFLLRRHGRSLQYRLLALLVIDLSIVLLGAVLGVSGLYRQWPHLIRVADPFILLFGPLLYFHVHAAVHGVLPRLAFVHLLPFVGYALWVVPFYVLPATDKIRLMELVMGPRLAPMLVTVLAVRVVHMLVYSVWTLAMIRRFQRRLRDQYSNVDERDLHRSVWFVHGYIGTTVCMIGIIVLTMFLRINVILANGIFGLVVSAGVYALAYVSWPHRAGSPVPLTEAPVGISTERVASARPAADRPRRNVHYLSDPQFASLADRMVRELERGRAYLDGELTLAQLSERVGAPAHQVSETISRHYGSNFFDAVNRLRVEEAKRRLLDPAFAGYSILGISMDAGFNSKSSFNTAFRKHTGRTPSEFRKV